MIKDIHCHPLCDTTGEDILIGIHKLSTILGDHVANTDMHVLSSITKDDIDDVIGDIEDTDVISPFDNYYTKDEINNFGFLTVIPEWYVDESELGLAIEKLRSDINTNIVNIVNETVDLNNYYTKGAVDQMLSIYLKTSDLTSKLNDYYNKSTIDSKLQAIKTGSSVTWEQVYTNTNGEHIADISINGSKQAVYAPKSSSTGGGADGNSYVTNLSLNGTTLTLTQTEKASVSVDLKSLKGEGGGTTIINGRETYTAFIYKATAKDAGVPGKPLDSDWVFNFAEKKFDTLKNWYITPQKAIEAYSTTSNKCQVWFTYNVFADDGSNTGWATPLKWFNVNDILSEAETTASKFAEGALNQAKSDLESAQALLNSTLDELSKTVDGHAEQIKNLNNGDVIEAAVSGIKKIYSWIEVSLEEISNGNIILSSIDFTINAPMPGRELKILNSDYSDIKYCNQYVFVNEKYFAYIATSLAIVSQIVAIDEELNTLKTAVENLEADSWRVQLSEAMLNDDSFRTALIQVLIDRIQLGVANSDGDAATFILSLVDGNSSTEITSDKIVLNGDVIAKAIATKDLVIYDGDSNPVASIDGDGTAMFGKGSSRFTSDGSGYIANSNISWDTNGDLTVHANGDFKGDVRATSFSVLSNNDVVMQMSTAESLRRVYDNVPTEPKDSCPMIMVKDVYTGEAYFLELTKLTLKQNMNYATTTSFSGIIIAGYSVGNGDVVTFVHCTRTGVSSDKNVYNTIGYYQITQAGPVYLGDTKIIAKHVVTVEITNEDPEDITFKNWLLNSEYSGYVSDLVESQNEEYKVSLSSTISELINSGNTEFRIYDVSEYTHNTKTFKKYIIEKYI